MQMKIDKASVYIVVGLCGWKGEMIREAETEAV